VANDGNVRSVLWDGPAFKAGLSTGVQIIAVNGVAFNSERLTDAIKGAQNTGGPIELIIKHEAQFRVTRIDYHDGLRYPHLERDTAQPARLDEILTARN
jgi:predicted metalloprotease with PDZ domain